MESPQSSFKNKLNRFIFLLIIGLITIFLVVFNFYYINQKKSRAAFEPILIDGQNLDNVSVFKKQNNLNFFSLYGKDKIYNLDSNQANLGMVAFINKDIQLKQDNKTEIILPKSINQELFLVKKYSENESNGTHFFYQQKINGLPIYGAFVNMHLKKNNQLYGLQGNVIENGLIPEAKITDDQAQTIAFNKANQETKNLILNIVRSEKLIFNKKILGISEDDKNYLVLAVMIGSKNMAQKPFAKKYFIDLVSGEIIFEENLIQDVLTRYIYDYRGLSDTIIPLSISEGNPPKGDADIDNSYNILGEIYNYYLNNFDRKSYDNQDSPLRAIVHINLESICPNALWLQDNKTMYICDGMVGKDIITHEVTHGVNSKLIPNFQSGSLGESLSDIMAVGLDKNWTMGEGVVTGIIRRVDDPPKSRIPEPDRLFSDYYKCADTAESSNDYGYLHTNMGVINKAFYLITQGGDFNNCQLTGVGMEKALLIIYRYMTIYLTPTENFKNTYNSILQSCNDLYQENSDTCNNVRRALQAVEIDQQPENNQKGAKCLNISEQAPICALNPSSPPSVTTTPTITVTSGPTLMPASTGTVTLSLSLKFQGIQSQPVGDLNSLNVKVMLAGGSLPQPKQADRVDTFRADEKGVWHGAADFDGVLPGEGYRVYIKGPYHLQKKICDVTPTESYPGSYHCSQGKITLQSGKTVLDFSSIYFLAGDLPEQDGIVNSYDTSLVYNNLGKKDAKSIKLADVNLDGIVDTQDFSLIISALSIRTDEE